MPRRPSRLQLLTEIVQAKSIHPNVIYAQKAKLRAEAASFRKKAWLNSGSLAAQAIVERGILLLESLAVAPAVAGYHPLKTELDPLPLLGALYDKGFCISLPRTGQGMGLSFKEWVPGSALEPGRLGVLEPAETQAEMHPAIILVPLLAFDRKGNRLGYGAGFYDASLRGMRKGRTIVAIGVAFDEQELSEIPQEPQDERLDMVLTPSRVMTCGN